MDIVAQLYFGSYLPGPTCSPKYKAAIEHAEPYWQKVSSAFSHSFFEELWDAQMEVTSLECQDYFRQGFLLGFQIAMAGMSEK